MRVNIKCCKVPEGAYDMPVNPARFWEGCAIRSIMAGTQLTQASTKINNIKNVLERKAAFVFIGAGGYLIGMVMGGFFHTMGPMDYEGRKHFTKFSKNKILFSLLLYVLFQCFV